MKKKIMIDMDDVITCGGFLHLINEYMNTNYTEEYFKDFYMQDIIPDKEDFFKFLMTKNQYDYCTLSDNVVEVLKELNDYYDIYIGTSYIFREVPKDCGIILKQKYDYLIKYFPFLNPYNFIFLGDKSVINCDIKIDDRIDNLTNCNIKILYTAYHNKDLPNDILLTNHVIRANNFMSIKNILLNNDILN